MPKKKKKKKKNEEISEQLLSELRKNAGFKDFSDAQRLSRQIGSELERARKRKRLSDQELAERIGRSVQIVRKIEKGEYRQFTVKLLMELAQATNSKLEIRFSD